MITFKNSALPFFKGLLLLTLGFFIFAQSVSAQRRDHLTYEEIEIVRDVQALDERMEVYVKAIDRRLMILNNAASPAKPTEKDAKKWGEPPTGSRLELLTDIKKILQEAIDKIDDVAAHDAKSELIPYAVHILADGVRRFAPEFEKMQETAAEKKEIGALADSLEFSSQIIEASTKIVKPVKKRPKAKGKG